jgi:hypothetical protein
MCVWLCVQDAIEQVMVEVAEMIMQGQGCGYSLSTRGTVYVEELNRIVLKDKATFASFSNANTTRKVRCRHALREEPLARRRLPKLT